MRITVSFSRADLADVHYEFSHPGTPDPVTAWNDLGLAVAQKVRELQGDEVTVSDTVALTVYEFSLPVFAGPFDATEMINELVFTFTSHGYWDHEVRSDPLPPLVTVKQL